MCGIVGFLNTVLNVDNANAVIHNMANAIKHRGPDSSGYWLGENTAVGLALGHRRLAIQDLSPAGAQPMQSACVRYTLVFNGEIYNHLEIREMLAADGAVVTWCGHSDTETLLAGFAQWGIEATLKKAVGMFAFAAYDAVENTLSLGRDRLGEKPLYYGWQGNSFIFASELAPFKAHPDFLNELDRQALTEYFRYAYVPGTQCIYAGLRKLEAGCLLTLSLAEKKISQLRYWSLLDEINKAKAAPFTGTADDAVEKLQQLFSQSVKNQMLADVPLGAFLSGGIDSSTVVALMQSQSAVPINTFSIGFDVPGFNEAIHAKAVAAHLGTNHTELYITAADALAVIPELANIYDEPFADSSQIPTYLVAKMAKQHVSVALSGDAGDELFCGYNRYIAAGSIWAKLKKVPLPLRKLLSKTLTLLPVTAWDKLFEILPLGNGWAQIGHKLHKAASVVAAQSLDDLYLGLVSQWQNPEALVKGSNTISTNTALAGMNLTDVETMMAKDTLGYLTDDILVKVDRAAMAVSLECRVPMLDHRIVEFAWSLPLAMKFKDGITKWPLRQVLYKFVPKALIERPKVGFAIPIDDWLRGPLKEWADALLSEQLINEQGFLNSSPIQKLWQEHKLGKRNHAAQLWCVLMFQAWLLKTPHIK